MHEINIVGGKPNTVPTKFSVSTIIVSARKAKNSKLKKGLCANGGQWAGTKNGCTCISPASWLWMMALETLGGCLSLRRDWLTVGGDVTGAV